MKIFKQKSGYILVIIFIVVTTNALYKDLGAGRDDTFITLWAGKSLGVADWFINYNGDRQEISSSILGALVAKLIYICCSAYYYLINKLLGWIAGLALLITIWIFRASFFRQSPDWSAITIIGLLGVNSAWAYWSLGGLETPYYSLLLLLYVTIAISIFDVDSPKLQWKYYSLALIQILTIICRPEGFWVIGLSAILAYFFWDNIKEKIMQLTTVVILVPLTFLVGLFLVRYAITGAIFPNPVYAKVDAHDLGNIQGYSYLADFYKTGLSGLLLGFVTVASYIYSLLLLLKRALRARSIPSFGTRYGTLAVTIAAYESFVILVHGDWMEYHRFIVPTLALKFIFLGILIEQSFLQAPKEFHKGVIVVFFVICLVSFWQEIMFVSNRDCSNKLSIDFLNRFMRDTNESLIELNCAGGRDTRAIRPFIDNEIPKLLNWKHHLTVLTYQGGYFPYFLREKYSTNLVTIVDSEGLLNLEIARDNVIKSNVGNYDHRNMAKILSDQAGELSKSVNKYDPNMIYLLSSNYEQRMQLEALGFHLIWARPGGVVFLK